MKNRLSYLTLVNVTLVLTYVLIVVGAATRVFDAGMSCPDWPHCYGLWWPWPEARVTALNGLGYVQQLPEGLRHYAWWQVFLEWSHRGLAAIVGLGVVGLLALAVPTRQPKRIWKPLGLLVALLILQIKLGAITVWFSNIHWSVAVHLGCAMLVFGCLVWLRRLVAVHRQLLATDLTKTEVQALMVPPVLVPMRLWVAATVFAVLVWLTMIIGATVSSAHAGGICGGLFSCDGNWHPADPFQKWHMLHRLMAVAVAVASIVMLVLAKKAFRLAAQSLHTGTVTPQPASVSALAHLTNIRKMALKLHLMVWGQVALGVATLYSFFLYPQFYFLLSISHLAWGTLVWLGALGALLTLRYGTAGRFHG